MMRTQKRFYSSSDSVVVHMKHFASVLLIRTHKINLVESDSVVCKEARTSPDLGIYIHNKCCNLVAYLVLGDKEVPVAAVDCVLSASDYIR